MLTYAQCHKIHQNKDDQTSSQLKSVTNFFCKYFMNMKKISCLIFYPKYNTVIRYSDTEREGGQWDVYQTSPQSLKITFFIHWFNNFGNLSDF